MVRSVLECYFQKYLFSMNYFDKVTVNNSLGRFIV